MRRVIIKARVVRQFGGKASVAGHLKYIAREGVGREGEAGQLYDTEHENADSEPFEKNCKGDRHHFRFIVSPEDGDKLKDLKPFVRDLMATAEQDLGTKLEWVAVDHYDTGYPHSHIIMRGKNDKGEDLIIPRDYISSGLRMRASELVTMELGPEAKHEVEARLVREVTSERLTSLDRSLRFKAVNGAVSLEKIYTSPSALPKPELLVRRLKYLEHLSLAAKRNPREWKLDDAMEKQLSRLSQRGDIIKSLNRKLMKEGWQHRAEEIAALKPSRILKNKLQGQVLVVMRHNELMDEETLVIEDKQKKLHAITVQAKDLPSHSLMPGTRIKLESVHPEPKPSDHTINKVAKENGGIYSAELHAQFDPTARPEYIGAHVRRLETLRRVGVVMKGTDKTWKVPKDYLDQARAFEIKKLRSTQISIAVLQRTIKMD